MTHLVPLFQPINARSVRFSSNQGFSLVELLVASVILAIGLLSVLTVQTTARSAQTYSNRVLQARMAVQTEIDRLRASDFSTLVNGTTTSSVSEIPTAILMVKVESYPTSSTSYLKHIVATVSWTNSSQNYIGGSVTSETLISRP